MDTLQRVYEFMESSGYYLLLTIGENGYPKGRAFTSKMITDGKLYLATGNAKRVYEQLKNNPKIEILAYQMKQREYMRLDAVAMIDENPEITKQYLEKEPQVRGDFHGDAEPQVGMFYLTDAKVEILSLDGTVKETFIF